MTPDERDGADRQAGARLLGRRLGRGQLRHRRLRAHHGAERPGAVLGARPRRRVPPAAAPLRARLRRARASASRAARTRATRSTATCAARRTRAPGSDFATVGDDLLRRRPTRAARSRFDIRSVMRAVDRPRPRAARALGRHARRRDRGRLGRPPRRLAGVRCSASSRARSPRHGLVPADGPEQWTSGTLFPRSSKKIARAINAASGRRPVVVLANLAGFDGSPESMRECSSSTAPRSAARSSTSTARSSSASSPATTAARSWCSRSG